MHRDKTLICSILKKIEASENGYFPTSFDIDGYDPDLVRYHLRLCLQAQFIEWPEAGNRSPASGWNITLTWHGHNVLDKLKEGCALKAITD